MRPDRILGCWAVDPKAQLQDAHEWALGQLAKRCGEEQALPLAAAKVATFSDEDDLIFAAHALAVSLYDLLAVAAEIGFKPGREFVAAVVSVRLLDVDEYPGELRLRAEIALRGAA